MNQTKIDKVELAKRIAALSAEKREAFEKLLLKEGIDLDSLPIVPQKKSPHGSPLSYAQQRLWFLDQLDPGIPYNIPQAIRLSGNLDIVALEQSLNEIAQRHEVLRTTFDIADGEPVQIVHEGIKIPLEIIDLTSQTRQAREAEAERHILQEARLPFDLRKGPLFRAKLLRLGESEYIFLPTGHHIVMDGWSLNLFIEELQANYTAAIGGELADTPALPIQYSDYAIWQRRHLSGQRLENKLSFWKDSLAGAPPMLEIPTDKARLTSQTFNGAVEFFSLSPETTKALHALSAAEGTTLFMSLLAVFKTVLCFHSGQDDIVVGTPVANRDRPEVEPLIGFFINNIVMRTDLSSNPSLRDLLARVRHHCVAAFDHQDLPFGKLVEELQPDRDMSRTPIFQVMFALQTHENLQYRLSGLELKNLEPNYDVSWFELSLALREREGELHGAFEYNTDLYEAKTVRRMISHFNNVADALVFDPNQRIHHLEFLNRDERHQLIVEWNETEKRWKNGDEFPCTKLFHRIFQEQVEHAPESVALFFDDEQLTYRELNARANRLAHHLRKMGVGPEVLVAVLMERSIDMMVALLGIMKAGGAYVPLDPTFPRDRISYILDDAKTAILLTEDALLARLSIVPDHTVTVCLDRDRETIAAQSPANPDVAVDPQNLAYAIYTSGSTGRPKGVAVPHGALMNFLHSMQDRPGLDENDILLAVTTLSFDIAGLELYLPLLAGAAVVIANREQTVDAFQLDRLLARSGANVMQATPATWRMLLDSGWQPARPLKVLCGGEAMPPKLAQDLSSFEIELWNMYGPTETTIWSTVRRLAAEEERITIGQPIANTQVYLLNEHRRLVPAGALGELHLGGHGLARGYLNRPDLTAEKFVPHPYIRRANTAGEAKIAAPGSRLYCTGDQARYVDDGELICLGRLDHQVKVRGYRIELGEIETVCASHPEVDKVVALVHEDDPENKVIVSYVVPRTGTSPAVNDLRTHLSGKLPEYMMPSAFVFLDDLPLTPNGKVDRKSLPAPEGHRQGSEANFVAPVSETEQEIAQVWSEILKIDRVGIQDGFFQLGGHSLLATRMISTVRDRFGVELPLHDFFMNPTVAFLSERVEAGLLSRSAEDDLDAMLDLLENVDEAEAEKMMRQ